jgi:tape measure domain-containing protein
VAGENISIEITDKVSSSISQKLSDIASKARTAHGAIKTLKEQLDLISGGALSKLEGISSRATRELQRASIASQRLATEQQRTATSSQKLATEQQRTASALANASNAENRAALSALRLAQAQEKASDSGSKLSSVSKSIAMLAGGGLSAGAILSVSEAYTVLQNKLQNVAESQGQVEELTKRLFDIASRTSTPILETAQAFTRFDMALKNLGRSQEDSLALTETVNKMLLISGVAPEEASSALLQLGDAFNKGKLDGDEFRTVMEKMPMASDAIAKSLGVTRNELLKLAPEGKITAKVMLEAFENVSKGLDEKLGNSVKTISHGMTIFKNRATETFGELDKSIGVTSSISKALIFLAENMKTVAFVATTMASVLVVAFGTKILGAFTNATRAAWAFSLALSANPISLLIVGLTSLISLITIFGDKWAMTADGTVTFKDVAKATFSFVADGFSSLSTLIGDGWNSAIDFVNSKTNGWGEQFRDVGSLISSALKIVANSLVGFFVGAYKVIVATWDRFPSAIKDVFALALNWVVSTAEKMINAVLEGVNKVTSLANQGSEKIGLGKVFEEGLSVSLDKYKMEVTGAASDLAKSVSKEFKSSMSFDYVGAAQGAIMTRARKIIQDQKNKAGSTDLRGSGDFPPASGGGENGGKGALKRALEIDKVTRSLEEELLSLKRLGAEYSVSNKLLEVENNLLDKKIKLTDGERESLKAKLDAIQNQKASNALAEINKELDQQSAILSKLTPQQEVAQQMQQYQNDLLSKGLAITKEQTSALQTRLEELQKEKMLSQEMNKIYSETQGKNLELRTEASALGKAYSDGSINLANYELRLKNVGLAMADLRLKTQEGSINDVIDTSLGSLVSNYDGVLSGLSESFGSFFTSFTDGFANSVGQAVVYAENLNDALSNVAKQAIAGLISSLVKLGIQYAVTAALGTSLGASSLAAQTAASSSAAALTATAWATPAAMVSLASFGANSAPASAGIAATTALSQGLALSSIAGFESGGYTGNFGTSEIAGVVHGKEYVFDAQATDRIGVENLEAIRNGASYISSAKSGGSSAGIVVNIENYGTNKDFEVQQISEGEVRIIARDEARMAVQKDTPAIIASEIRNPNSIVSKSLGQNTQTQRRR